MLAYAANARPAGRTGSPRALVYVLAGHALLIGAVLTVKMDLVGPPVQDPTDIVNVPIDHPLEPAKPQPPEKPSPQETFIDRAPKVVDMGTPNPTAALDQGDLIRDVISDIGTGTAITPLDPPKPVPVRVAAIFRTPDSALRPPYPTSKLRLEEEATLRLRLSIDTRGRVTSVDPVGAADPEFLAAARRHIIRSWRYKPATEDGVAVPTSTVITLNFRLENA